MTSRAPTTPSALISPEASDGVADSSAEETAEPVVEPNHDYVTLGQLRTFLKRAKAAVTTFATSGALPEGFDQELLPKFADVSWDNMTVLHAVHMVVKPDGIAQSRRWSGAALYKGDSHAGRTTFARHIVNYRWEMHVRDFESAIEWWADARCMRDEETMFVCFLCLNQHSEQPHSVDGIVGRQPDQKLAAEPRELSVVTQVQNEVQKRLLDGVESVLSLSGRRDTEAYTRSWVLFEVHLAFLLGVDVDFVSPTGIVASRTPFRNGGMAYGSYPVDVASSVFNTNALFADSKAFMQEHQDAILRNVAVLDDARFTKRLQRTMAGPLFRDAAASGDVGQIEKMCADKGFVLSSNRLCGSLGESAMHVAAAAGKADVLRALLVSGPAHSFGVRSDGLEFEH